MEFTSLHKQKISAITISEVISGGTGTESRACKVVTGNHNNY